MYEYADKQIKDINRRNLRSFDRLKTLKFDELNVFKQVTTVYEDSVKLCKKRYKWIAEDAYIAALLLLRDMYAKRTEEKREEKGKPQVDVTNITKEEAKELAEKRITGKWLDKLLNDPDPVTLYKFEAEAERKKNRLIEALMVAHSKVKEIDKALRLWTLQTAHYADKSVDSATLEAYTDAGVEKVQWITMEDLKVCSVCAERDGKVYAIDKVPPKPHLRCRCELHPYI